MRVFVTGASGFIGSAVVPALIGAGHDVVGLARSDASAAAVEAAGAAVHRGALDDLDSLRAGAAKADGVIHLAFIHDFSQYQNAGLVDRLAIEALGAELEGSGRPLVITSGTLGLTLGRTATEEDGIDLDAETAANRRSDAYAVRTLAARGVRASVARLAPSVHDETKKGFVGQLVDIAVAQGAAGYVGDGANRWSTLHRLDAADLYVRALEQAPAGAVLHGVGEEGVPIRVIAEAIARHLGLPAVSVDPADAAAHFGWMGGFIGADAPASSARTQALLGWRPTGPTLIEDLDRWFAHGPAAAAVQS